MLINRNFTFFWLGQTISILGDAVYGSALILWIATILAHNQSWAPLAVSGTLLAQYLPIALVGPLAGVFVDRWQARKVMLHMDAIRTLLIAALTIAIFIASLHPGISTWQQLGIVYGVTLLESGCGQFFNPARLTLVGDIVEATKLPQATSFTQATIGLSTVVGPALAALMVFGLGMQWALLLNAGSFAFSFLTLAMIRYTPRIVVHADDQRTSLLTEFRAGLHIMLTSRVLLMVLFASILFYLAVGAFNELSLFFITGVLHAPAALFGPLATVMGIGAIAGALLAGRLARPLGLIRLLWGSALCMGITFILVTIITNVSAAFVITFLCGCFVTSINVATQPLILQFTPRAFVGRINALVTPIGSMASVISILLCGTLSSNVPQAFTVTILTRHLNIVQLLWMSIGLLLVLGGLVICFVLRNIHTQPATETSTAKEPALPARI